MFGLDTLEEGPSGQLGWRRIYCGICLLRSLLRKVVSPLPQEYVLTYWKVFFAACASFLVRNYAIYARHSGIPEIKTVLGGFVMKQFMSGWTLVTKSLGLVSSSDFPSYLLMIFSFSSEVSFSCIWTVAWKGRPACTCCMLLRQYNNEAVR